MTNLHEIIIGAIVILSIPIVAGILIGVYW